MGLAGDVGRYFVRKESFVTTIPPEVFHSRKFPHRNGNGENAEKDEELIQNVCLSTENRGRENVSRRLRDRKMSLMSWKRKGLNRGTKERKTREHRCVFMIEGKKMREIRFLRFFVTAESGKGEKLER